MTAPSPLAKLALRALADAPVDVEPPSPRDEEAAIAAIARELETRRRRRSRRVALLASVSFAAAAALVVTLGGASRRTASEAATVESVSGTVLVVRGHEGVTLGQGARVGRGDRVVASAAGSTVLRLRKGTELRAMSGADVRVAEDGRAEVLELHAGSVQLHVAKLAPGDQFIVRTSDAEVEVRGTQFRVDVGEPCAGTATRVAVTEGVVVVRHAGAETRLVANESWPTQCIAQTAAAPPAHVPAPARSREESPEPASIPDGRVGPQAAPPAPVHVAPPTSSVAIAAQRSSTASSDSAEQNRLFTEAMAAKRRGDRTAALDSLDRLTSAFPHGLLAESAAVERMRILAASDPTRAAEAARTYLARHPNGYARGEALKLTGSP